MKKIVTLLIAVVLLIPMVVKADMLVVHTYYNSKVMVDGEEEVHIPVDYLSDYELEITYDKAYLETSKDMITLSKPTSIVIENDERKTVNNLLEVTVADGKISIKAKVFQDQGVVGDMPNPEINLKFKALKVGTTTIKIGGKLLYDNETTKITIVEKSCPATTEEPSTTEPAAEEPASSGNSEVKEETKPAKEEKRDKDLFLYISLGANALLLIGLIIVALKKNKKVEPVASPVVETPVDPAPVEAPVVEQPTEETPPTENNNE